VAGITTAASILVSTFGAYALSRYQFRYKTLYDRSLLLVYMLPSVAIAIPMFMIIRSYGLLDTHSALILSYTTSTLPFSIWMLRGYFQSVPYSLEEAAMIDGASRLQALFRVVLPVSLPGIAAVAAFAFILAWNEFLFASTFIQSSHKYTLAVGLRTFQQQFDVEFDLLMAASTISSIPIVVMFGFAQRFLVEGLTAGANKG
jgi:ABC-type sugar transport system, permease component